MLSNKEKSAGKFQLRKTAGKRLKETLELKRTHLGDSFSKDQKELALAFADEYKAFLNLAKTEREAVAITRAAAEELGFQDIDTLSHLQAGSKVYRSIKGKGLALAVVGKKAATEGFHIVGAHIDAPRLDLKPVPLYEEEDLVFFKTHYYGGIKKYQWAALPLALHGVVYRQDGTCLHLALGEGEGDPQFTVTDLLPHLAAEQMSQKAADFIPAENLNILIGASPHPEKQSGRFKLETLRFLNESYGITEKDLCSAELSAVPAAKAVDIGFDRMMVGSYGQDDRVCAYPAIQAIFSLNKPTYSAVCLLTDKEEIGSDGNSGAASRLYENFLAEILAKQTGGFDPLAFQEAITHSVMLSADVTNAYDPNFPDVSDLRNAHKLGHGISLVKYTGAKGKYSSSDASAEFFSSVVRLLDAEKISWQTGEIGRVDAGGGGTIAKYFANLGMDVLDSGVPVLSMHAPFEISHKLDLYETYLAYRSFFEKYAYPQD